MRNDFPLYTTDYISGVMSLRKPQKESLKILEEIVNSVQLRKGMNLKAALGAVHAMYPICSDFEREFLSLTFALATHRRGQDPADGGLYRLSVYPARYQEFFCCRPQHHDL